MEPTTEPVILPRQLRISYVINSTVAETSERYFLVDALSARFFYQGHDLTVGDQVEITITKVSADDLPR